MVPKALVSSFRGSSDLTSPVKLVGRIDLNHDTHHFCTPFRINEIESMPVTWYFSPPEKLRDIAFIYQSLSTRKNGGYRESPIRLGRLKKAQSEMTWERG